MLWQKNKFTTIIPSTTSPDSGYQVFVVICCFCFFFSCCFLSVSRCAWWPNIYTMILLIEWILFQTSWVDQFNPNISHAPYYFWREVAFFLATLPWKPYLFIFAFCHFYKSWWLTNLVYFISNAWLLLFQWPQAGSTYFLSSCFWIWVLREWLHI